MPFAFLILGSIFIVSGIRGTDQQLFTLIKGDFSSTPASSGQAAQPSFIAWLFALLVIGGLGYIKPIAPISKAFLALVILVLFLKNGNPNGKGGGFFAELVTGIDGPTAASSSTSSGNTIAPTATIK
jgi:hypothetical protein